MTNTLLCYQYRDGSNHKISKTVVFEGSLNAKEKSEINSLIFSGNEDDDWIIPGQVGLTDLQNTFISSAIERFSLMTGSLEDARAREAIKELERVKPIWWPDDIAGHEVLDLREVADEISPTDPRTIHSFLNVLRDVVWDRDYRPPFFEEMHANYLAHVEAENSNQNPE